LDSIALRDKGRMHMEKIKQARACGGFEELVIVVGEKYLLCVPEDAKLAFSDGVPAYNNMVCVVKEIFPSGAVEVEVEGRPVGANRLSLTLKWIGKGDNWLFGYWLKPYWVRTVNLSQGLEWDNVEVYAKSFMLPNQLYNACARVKTLAGLKISKVGTPQRLERLNEIHYKALLFYAKHGRPTPRYVVAKAEDKLRAHNEQWAAVDARRGRGPGRC